VITFKKDTELLHFEHEVHHNADGKFETTDRIDPATGEYFIKAMTVILTPGRIHEVSVALADELRALCVGQPYPCIREPTEREVMSYRHARGELVDI